MLDRVLWCCDLIADVTMIYRDEELKRLIDEKVEDSKSVRPKLDRMRKYRTERKKCWIARENIWYRRKTLDRDKK